jgi:hypothetical protein
MREGGKKEEEEEEKEEEEESRGGRFMRQSTREIQQVTHVVGLQPHAST